MKLKHNFGIFGIIMDCYSFEARNFRGIEKVTRILPIPSGSTKRELSQILEV